MSNEYPPPQDPNSGAGNDPQNYGGPAGYGPPPVGAGGPPPQYSVDPQAPFGRDPMGRPYSDKQQIIVGILNIFIAGVGRMYAGQVGLGVAQLAVAILTCGIGALWSLIDGILILINGGQDKQGRPLRP